MAKRKKVETEYTVITYQDEVEEKLVNMALRARGTKPAMQLIAEYMSTPQSRTDPARYVNDDMPLGRGKGGGYQKHIKMTGLVRSVKQAHTRPGAPRVRAIKDVGAMEKIAAMVEQWILKAKK